jgi:hypothetical protein
MEHIKIDLTEREAAAQERRAKRAEEAMEAMRNRSSVNDFGMGPRVFSYDANDAEDLARVFNEILDAAERESVELSRDAEHYLQQAAAEMADRAESRDTEDGERSMARAVEAFNSLYGHDLPAALKVAIARMTIPMMWPMPRWPQRRLGRRNERDI